MAHIEPKKAIFLFQKPSDKSKAAIMVGDSDRRGTYGDWPCSHGAVYTHWKSMSDEQIYQAMTWLALEMVEFPGIPIRMVRDAMSDSVIGYREYCDRSGKLALRGYEILANDRSNK